jgi:hypothetical protein
VIGQLFILHSSPHFYHCCIPCLPACLPHHCCCHVVAFFAPLLAAAAAAGAAALPHEPHARRRTEWGEGHVQHGGRLTGHPRYPRQCCGGEGLVELRVLPELLPHWSALWRALRPALRRAQRPALCQALRRAHLFSAHPCPEQCTLEETYPPQLSYSVPHKAAIAGAHHTGTEKFKSDFTTFW